MPLRQPEILLYMDESGSRDPDRHPREKANSPDWFGIGGVLVKATDKADIEAAMDNFRLRWPQMGEHPFRSYDIRNKTAFHIAVERAAKYALHHGARMRVYVERSDKVTEAQLKGYFDAMRKAGQPFNSETSAKYLPMQAEQLNPTLFEFGVKTKGSQLMQLADLVLWPICRGGYSRDDRAYGLLKASGQLLDAHCTPANGLMGIKYFCF